MIWNDIPGAKAYNDIQGTNIISLNVWHCLLAPKGNCLVYIISSGSNQWVVLDLLSSGGVEFHVNDVLEYFQKVKQGGVSSLGDPMGDRSHVPVIP